MSRDKAPPPPDSGNLYQAALHYLARYAATETGLRRVLARKIDRWARTQTDADAAEPVIVAARTAIDGVVERLVKAGAVSDTIFAEARAHGLIRAGQSNRAVQARLVAKGVAPELARAVSVTDAETELAAALVLTRKRRIGPYRPQTQDGAGDEAQNEPTVRMKDMGLLARAGFSRGIAEQALDTPREDAENRIRALRQ
jgi:regulatory protein